jgi:DNA-directed RNA polymerase specialized sigma24 family protein
MDRIIFGAFQVGGLSMDEIARALKIPLLEVQDAIRRGVYW